MSVYFIAPLKDTFKFLAPKEERVNSPCHNETGFFFCSDNFNAEDPTNKPQNND